MPFDFAQMARELYSPVRPVGDVIDAKKLFSSIVNRGLDLARPIMPPMGAVPPGGSGSVAKMPSSPLQGKAAQKAYERLIKNGALAIFKEMDVNNLKPGWDAYLQTPFQRGSAANQANDVKMINEYLANPPRQARVNMSDDAKYQQAIIKQLYGPKE